MRQRVSAWRQRQRAGQPAGCGSFGCDPLPPIVTAALLHTSPSMPPLPHPTLTPSPALTRVHDGAVLGAQHQAAAVWDGVRDADGRALKGAQLEGLPHVDGVQPALVVQVELLRGAW